MVDREKRIEDILETIRRSDRSNLLRLHDELKERYSNEDFDRICSGEGWLDLEGVCTASVASVLSPMGMAGAMLIPLIIPMIKALVTLAFLLGYEKAKGEMLAEELGLEENDE
jgi:hypothetical protein